LEEAVDVLSSELDTALVGPDALLGDVSECIGARLGGERTQIPSPMRKLESKTETDA
jgi:hypothetical protein